MKTFYTISYFLYSLYFFYDFARPAFQLREIDFFNLNS